VTDPHWGDVIGVTFGFKILPTAAPSTSPRMNSPFTDHPLDAFIIAETSVALTLTAVLFHRRARPSFASSLLLAAVWLAAGQPALLRSIRELGIPSFPMLGKGGWPIFLLDIAGALCALGALATGRRRVAAVGVLVAAALHGVDRYIQNSTGDLAALHVAFVGLLIGLCCREEAHAVASPRPSLSYRWDDALLAVLGTTLGVVVCWGVLDGLIDSADEWAYTVQAAIFAKGRVFAPLPQCSAAFENFWVFHAGNREFSEYTPGWSMFVAPFMTLGVVWLAGPASLGLLGAAVARLTRRVVRDAGYRAMDVRAAGVVAGLAVMLGSSMLLNGGSRYCHLFVSACFALALESVLAVGSVDERSKVAHGARLGLASAWLLSTRPADGATLGVGLFVLYAIALVRGRIPRQSVLASVATFATLGGIVLVVLRLQLGRWFMTGYALNPILRPWNDVTTFSIPNADEFSWSVPLATGAFCWWPCAPSVAFAGLASLGRGARLAKWGIVLCFVPFLMFYMLIEVGRGSDWGYGPRYQLPLVVPMAIGVGAVLGPLVTMARRGYALGKLYPAAPLALALSAWIIGIVRIAPLMFPYARAVVEVHDTLALALRSAPIDDAIVLASGPIGGVNPLDVTENLPLMLYPEQRIFVANEVDAGTLACLRAHYPARRIFRVVEGPPIGFAPL